MTRTRRIPQLFAAALAALALVMVPLAPASAAGQTGWVRLAHLSPDTAAVNATLSSLSGKVVLFRLTNVSYGAVSKYMRLPQGTYALAMVPAKARANATPVISGSVKVIGGAAQTIAAIGLNKDIQAKAFRDDLAAAGGNQTKIRVVQASVKHSTVSIKAGSKTIAAAAAFGDVTPYVTVPAGKVTVTMTGGSDRFIMSDTFAAGSAHTLFVIDDKKGQITASPALDSSASTVAPVGSVAAGGGGLAADQTGLAAALAVGAAAAGVVAGGVMLRRRSGAAA